MGAQQDALRDVESSGDGETQDRHAELVRLAGEVGELWGERGGMRTAGRVFGYLLFSDASGTSARELRTALDASAGAVSGATRYLIAVGLVRAVPGPERRQQYYAAAADPFTADLVRARQQLGRWNEIAVQAAVHLGSEHPGARRAQDLLAYVALLDEGLARVITMLPGSEQPRR